jgi:hypothetical protein
LVSSLDCSFCRYLFRLPSVLQSVAEALSERDAEDDQPDDGDRGADEQQNLSGL